MKLFNFRKKEEKNKSGEEFITKMALQEALRELEEEKTKNEDLRNNLEMFDRAILKLEGKSQNLERNLEVLQVTIENVRNMCKNQNGRVISSKIILKEIGE